MIPVCYNYSVLFTFSILSLISHPEEPSIMNLTMGMLVLVLLAVAVHNEAKVRIIGKTNEIITQKP